MFVGEAPGHVNDEVGRPFVGHGGKILDSILKEVGIVRDEVFITNAVKCWPPSNRKPKPDELKECQSYLDSQIQLVNPRLIIALGTTAFTLLTNEKIRLKEEHGKIVYRGAIPVCALFHPNGLRYIRGGRQTIVNGITSVLDKLKIPREKPVGSAQSSLFRDEICRDESN